MHIERRAQIRSILDDHDGTCLDNHVERDLLACALEEVLGADQLVVVLVEGGLISGATAWPTLEQTERAARSFLAAADLEVDDVAVLRLGHGQVELMLTSKQLLDAADQ